MHRFLIGQGHAVGNTCSLNAAEAEHASRVLRLKQGARVQLLDGQGKLFLAELVQVDEAGTTARLIEDCPAAEPPIALTLYQGLPKFEKLEWIAQKATELGIWRIVPVQMERSVVKLSSVDGAKKRDRLHKICQEAAKQCGRARVPEVLAPVSYRDALALIRQEQLMWMAWEQAHELSLGLLRERFPEAERIGLLIGPEGGISPKEAEAAIQAGALTVTLGPRILRTETAALAAVALVMQLWGDL